MTSEGVDPFEPVGAIEEQTLEGLGDDAPDSPKSARVASEGKKQNIPVPKDLPPWPSAEDQDRQDHGDEINEKGDGFIDYKDLEAINKDLSNLRLLQNFMRRKVREAEREAGEAKFRYQQRLRRQLVQQSGGSAETRKAMAEIFVEDYEIEMIVKAQVASEWASRSRGIRDDIENTKVVAYNMRNLMPS